MKAVVSGALVLLAVSTGCADLYEVDPAYAARADSSAAGYQVSAAGGAPSGAHAPASPSARDARRPGGTRPTPEPRRRDTPRATARQPGPAPTPATVAAGTGPASTFILPDSSARDSAALADSGVSAPDVATLPAALTTPVDDSIVVNTFLAFNPAARMVWIDLIAGLDGANGSLNFNGGHGGSHTVIVPEGWRVEVRIANRDQDLSHSAVVVRQIDPIPVLAPPAAFPGSFSIALEEGLVEGRSDAFRFSADRVGRYMLMCAVPGHAQSGMWLRLDVSGGLAAPEYRR